MNQWSSQQTSNYDRDKLKISVDQEILLIPLLAGITAMFVGYYECKIIKLSG